MRCADARATRVPRALLERLPISQAASRQRCGTLWSISTPPRARRQVCGTDDLPTPPPEMALGLITCPARAVPRKSVRFTRAMANPAWRRPTRQTLGVIGASSLGRQMAGHWQVLLGMKVLAWSRMPGKAAAGGCATRQSRRALAESDMFIDHSKLSERARRGARELSLINGRLSRDTARGPGIDRPHSWRRRSESTAALDVFDVEPMPLTIPSPALENVYWRRVGYVTEELSVDLWRCARDIVAFLDGKLVRPLNTLS